MYTERVRWALAVLSLAVACASDAPVRAPDARAEQPDAASDLDAAANSDAAVPPIQPIAPPPVAPGYLNTCAVLPDGRLKCWGANSWGSLGLGDRDARGDAPGEMGRELPAVNLGNGRTALAVSSDGFHTCAILDRREVKCWGFNDYGKLGLGSLVASVGGNPGEMGDALPLVHVGTGRTVQALALGAAHSCALLDRGRVKCWGINDAGELGLGDTSYRGDGPNEMGDDLPDVDLGTERRAVAISAGGSFTCALLDNARIKCWGDNGDGQLGVGDTLARGAFRGEMGDSLPYVDLGTDRTALAVSAGGAHACALLDTGAVKCWGRNTRGRLGLGDTSPRGDAPADMGDALPAVNLGTDRTARAIAAGGNHTCALLDDHTLKCWGYNASGQLGLGDALDRGSGTGEMGDALPTVDLGANARIVGVAAGAFHTCAVLNSGEIKCWGQNDQGELGVGDTTHRGEVAGQMGDALPAVVL